MLTGAGVFFPKILNIIIHDAVDPGLDHPLHIVKINPAIIGIVIASGECTIAVARVISRASVDLHEGSNIDTIDLIIVCQKR